MAIANYTGSYVPAANPINLQGLLVCRILCIVIYIYNIVYTALVMHERPEASVPAAVSGMCGPGIMRHVATHRYSS